MNLNLKKLAAGAALALGAVAALAATPIKIGSVLSVTGPAAFLGDPELKTLQMYVADINKKGGVLGRQLELVHYDDGSDANKANGFTKRLIEDDKVDILVGGKGAEGAEDQRGTGDELLDGLFHGFVSSVVIGSDTLDHHGDPLPDTDTHGAQGIATATAFEFIGCGGDQAGTAHAERVAHGDGTAVRVHMRPVIGQTEVA